jgi:hypothetical protein
MNRRDFCRVLSLPALPALLVAGEPPQTTITVHVTKETTGKPVDNAFVILDFLGDRQASKLGKREKIHWEMRTNLEGVAHFPPIRRGKVRIQVIATNYQSFGQDFDLGEDEKKIDVKLNLPQRQYSAHGDTDPRPTTGEPPKQQPQQ